MITGQVFLSHTSDMARYPDERSFVQAALDAISRAGLAPVDMRYFPALDRTPADYCRQRVRECEIYLAVVGFSYGSLTPGETVSYTELEFREAGGAGLPRLVFLLDEIACPPDLIGTDRDLAEEFRQRLLNAGLLVRGFVTCDGLELEIFHALSELTARTSSAVPRIWNVPNRNADFTGRGSVLEQLRDDLTAGHTSVVLARALYGLGGIGKTQIALEYAHRFQDSYDLIWWIPAEQPEEINLSLADLGRRLGLQADDSPTQAATAVLEQLRRERSGRWLIIFDNAEDPVGLNPYLPSGSGHVLVTSRGHAWRSYAEPLELNVFTRQESVAHLMRHVPGLTEDDADMVAAAVGDLPLAIEQAGAWLSETGMSATLYVNWLETQAHNALGFNKPADYAAPVAATWDLSFARLRERSPAALRLLQILAFCSPEKISMRLLYSDAMIDLLLPFDESLHDKYLLGQVIREIGSLALAKIDQADNSLQIHRLVQAVIRSQMTETQQRETRHELHKILVASRPRQGEIDDPTNWPAYELIWPHLIPSHADECPDDQVRQLLIDWVRYQWKLGLAESALELGRRLRERWTRELGPDHQQTLHLQFQMANVLRLQGRFQESRDLDAYVLGRQNAVLGVQHLHSLMTANGLAADLRSLGDFSGSLALDQATYDGFRDHFGRDHPRTLSAAHNLAASLRLMGDCFTARRLDEETLERRRRVAGAEHPYTLHSESDVAQDLRAAGQYRESADLLRVTWSQYRKVLGDDMRDTLRAGTSLAAALSRAGDRAEALSLGRDMHERYTARYGKTAPDTLTCTLILAGICAAADSVSQAVELAGRVRAAHREDLGDDHPNTLVAANNLACYLRRAERLPEALALLADTLPRLASKLGDRHPLTLACAVNLASAQSDAGDLSPAQARGHQAVLGLREVLGQDHPDTLAAEANLAVTLHRAGQHRAAEELRDRVLDAFGQVLGPGHPDAALLLDWQRLGLDPEALRI
jgi:hypothetical protein